MDSLYLFRRALLPVLILLFIGTIALGQPDSAQKETITFKDVIGTKGFIPDTAKTSIQWQSSVHELEKAEIRFTFFNANTFDLFAPSSRSTQHFIKSQQDQNISNVFKQKIGPFIFKGVYESDELFAWFIVLYRNDEGEVMLQYHSSPGFIIYIACYLKSLQNPLRNYTQYMDFINYKPEKKEPYHLNIDTLKVDIPTTSSAFKTSMLKAIFPEKYCVSVNSPSLVANRS